MIDERQKALYVHVDDGVVITGDEDSSATPNDLMERAADALEDEGFVVRDRTASPEVTKVLGYGMHSRRSFRWRAQQWFRWQRWQARAGHSC